MKKILSLALLTLFITLYDLNANPEEETGSLEGFTLLDAEKLPQPEQRENDTDAKTCGHKITNESLIASKIEDGWHKGKIALKNVVIEIDIGRKGKRYDSANEFIIDQKGCVYNPHLIVVKRNSDVIFKNSDDVAHNVHCHAKKNPSPNFNQVPGSTSKYKARINETIKIACDIHPWMSSYIVVVNNPNYVKLSDAKGMFKIDDIPAGKYKVRFWHEQLGEIEKEVEIKPDETTKLEASFKVNSGS